MPVPIFSSGDDMGALLRVPLYFGRKDETQPHIYLVRPCPCFVNAIRFPPSPAMMWKHKSLWPGWRMCWYESFPWKNRCSLAKQIKKEKTERNRKIIVLKSEWFAMSLPGISKNAVLLEDVVEIVAANVSPGSRGGALWQQFNVRIAAMRS